jgi:hypothetical protein
MSQSIYYSSLASKGNCREVAFWIKSGVPIYDPSLPVSFHCPECKKNYQLKGSEAEKQTPPELLPQFLSFQCPGCRTVLKANVEQGHWRKDMSDRKSVYILNRTELV